LNTDWRFNLRHRIHARLPGLASIAIHHCVFLGRERDQPVAHVVDEPRRNATVMPMSA
jgi:hypothetical protein